MVHRFSELAEQFGAQFGYDEPLAKYTAARLGGRASGLLRAKSSEDLCRAVEWAQKREVRWLILGGGANVLISDRGFDGMVIINQSTRVQIDEASGLVEAESGANVPSLARRCIAKSLKGLEWAVNVPGTVGGAVVNNAGAHGGDIAGCLVEGRLLFDGEIVVWTNADFEYGYRQSRIKAGEKDIVVLSARFQLEPGHDTGGLTQTADGFVAHRKQTQPPGASLGSMFKNPPDDYAGRLIEGAGLKGARAGGVQVSEVHANFFVNLGGGTAEDYNTLIELAQRTVLEKFGVRLELEVERLGDW